MSKFLVHFRPTQHSITKAPDLRKTAIAHGPAARSAEWDFSKRIAHGPAARSAEWDLTIASAPRTRRTVYRMEARVGSDGPAARPTESEHMYI